MYRFARVLVVDDDETIATTLAMILNNSGFEAVAAFSGPEAIQLAHASRFDILVSDVMMEPVDGVQLAIHFRNINPASRIFLFTGTAEAASKMLAAVRAGYDFQMFSKPIPPAVIIEALRREWNPVNSGTRACPEWKTGDTTRLHRELR